MSKKNKIKKALLLFGVLICGYGVWDIFFNETQYQKDTKIFKSKLKSLNYCDTDKDCYPTGRPCDPIVNIKEKDIAYELIRSYEKKYIDPVHTLCSFWGEYLYPKCENRICIGYHDYQKELEYIIKIREEYKKAGVQDLSKFDEKIELYKKAIKEQK
ncbi:MAG: hypothetical protein CME70_16215 [Halobacteriovorax sp.]|nr:hypothetical protein [Halobacteriovorax sp.]|tara:strand:- start:110988 stop:111458 length:471 start_codon:yes stop_codon:yes gene_type:complete